jgi:hypothetical protein
MKHTPGPWRIAKGRETADFKHRFIWSDAELREEREDGSPYCVATVHERTFCSQLDANAALIAAAPDMAEALLYVIDCIARDDVTDMQPVREALAKAGI